MFRFRTIDEAAAAPEAVNADYERHCHAARDLAACFDAEHVAARILDETLGSRANPDEFARQPSSCGAASRA
jgi:hypothetical protein